jgi:NTE family protein
VSARTIFNPNDNIPLMYANFVGGQYNGHYVPQQIALQGTRVMELLKNTVVAAQTNIRYHFTPNHCIHTNLNCIVHHDKLLKLTEGQSFLGGSIGYSYNSIVGPMLLDVGYSGLSKSLYPFISIGYYF